MQNMATFHHSETAYPHFSSSLLQSDKIDLLSFYLYYRNTNRYLAKQDDAIRTEIFVIYVLMEPGSNPAGNV